MCKILLFVVAAFTLSANAVHVEMQCATKAYTCNGFNGCGWVPTANPAALVVPMYKDPGYPNKDAPYEVYRATYLRNYDHHRLTLMMEVRSPDPGSPVYVQAKLDGGNVYAEATAKEQLEIGIRGNNYGRGFICSSFKALN